MPVIRSAIDAAEEVRSGRESVECSYLGLIPYGEALALQLARREALLRGEGRPVVLILEHPPTVTVVRRSGGESLLFSPDALRDRGVFFADTDRGGAATAHEPGQLVAYPILDLRRLGLGVREYVASLEEAMIRTAAFYGVKLGRRKGFPGVWAGREKVGFVGIHVSRGATLHGLSLNASNDLSTFDLIVPCGIEGVGVTTLGRLAGERIETADAAPRLSRALGEALGLRLNPPAPG